MADTKDLKLPVKVRRHSSIDPSSASDDVVVASSAVKPAKRICMNNSPTGKRMKWSKQRLSWRVALPELGDHEVLLQVHRSLRGRRCVFINGDRWFDTNHPLAKVMVHFKLA